MTAKQWKTKIKKACNDAGTYRKCFDALIDTLAAILEKRDKAEESFQAAGGEILVTHINKAGAENIEQNPAIRLINDLNRDALSYWKELGLTAASLKRINEAAIKSEVKVSALEEALMKLD